MLSISVNLILIFTTLILIWWELGGIKEAINRQTESLEQSPCPCNYPADEEAE